MTTYKTIREISTLDTPESGQFAGAMMQSMTLPFYGVYWKHRIAAGATGFKLPVEHANYIKKNGTSTNVINSMLRRVVVFRNGRKLALQIGSSVPGWDGTLSYSVALNEVTVSIPSLPVTDSDYIEVFVLNETVFNGSSHYNKVTFATNQPGTEYRANYTLTFNPSAYVNVTDFYRNVLVFKNGLFMVPGRTYWWWGPTLLNFKDVLLAGDTLEFYFLNKSSTKKYRVYGEWPVSVAETSFTMPEFPNTPITLLP